jgi:hypothetical protein
MLSGAKIPRWTSWQALIGSLWQEYNMVRLKIFDLIDAEGWTPPVGLRIDESQGFPDVIVETYDDLPEAM